VRKLLITAIAKINEEKTLYLVRQALEKGIEPFTILEDVRRGLEIVVEMYNQGKYFLADLVMAAEIYKEAQQIVLGPPQEGDSEGSFQIVFGTVKKDIHDIGKNITIVTMRQYGLRVLDLGVDVSPQMFINALGETGASILCMSCLISEAYDSIKETIKLVKKEFAHNRPTTIIGGRVNETICNYTGADYWVKSCIDGTFLCRKILAEHCSSSTLNQ